MPVNWKRIVNVTDLLTLGRMRENLTEMLNYIECQISLIKMDCSWFEYDDEACEEYCHNPKNAKKFAHKDFYGGVECVKCKFYDSEAKKK